MKKTLLLSTISLGLVSVCTAVIYYDYRHESVSEIIELYNQKEELALTEPENVKGLWGDASILISALGKKGGEEFLPFLMEKSLSTNLPEIVRENSAIAYFKIADLEESVNLLVQYCNDPTVESGKALMAQRYLDKLNASDINSIAPETKDYINTCLLKILLTTDVRTVGNRLNIHLLNAIPSYSNSIQRATLTRFATEGNEWVTNTFHPIKAHFGALPKSELVDLRRQFPDLPPLPNNVEETIIPKWVYGVGGLLLVVVGVSLAVLLKKGYK